jgi:hypothetical protein
MNETKKRVIISVFLLVFDIVGMGIPLLAALVGGIIFLLYYTFRKLFYEIKDDFINFLKKIIIPLDIWFTLGIALFGIIICLFLVQFYDMFFMMLIAFILSIGSFVGHFKTLLYLFREDKL